MPAATIRRIAAELAQVAFEQAIELPVAWTDARTAPRHDAGRPGRDACHARHLGAFERLPHLPRHSFAADAARHRRRAGRVSLQVALSQAGAARAEAGRQARPVDHRPAAAGHAARLPEPPEDLLVDAEGRPARIDKAYSWEAPLAAHGLLHMVIANAAPAIPTRSIRSSSTWRTWRGTRR